MIPHWSGWLRLDQFRWNHINFSAHDYYPVLLRFKESLDAWKSKKVIQFMDTSYDIIADTDEEQINVVMK